MLVLFRSMLSPDDLTAAAMLFLNHTEDLTHHNTQHHEIRVASSSTLNLAPDLRGSLLTRFPESSRSQNPRQAWFASTRTYHEHP